MGISAGAIMLCAWWAEWPDSPDDGLPHDGGVLVPCAAVLPDFVVDCHAEEDQWGELRLVRAMLHERPESPPHHFLGLPTGAGVIVTPGRPLESVGVAPYRLP